MDVDHCRLRSAPGRASRDMQQQLTLDAQEGGVYHKGARLIKYRRALRARHAPSFRRLLQLALSCQPPAELHVVQSVRCGPGLLHLADGGDAFVISAKELPRIEGEDPNLVVGRGHRSRHEMLSCRRYRDRDWDGFALHAIPCQTGGVGG